MTLAIPLADVAEDGLRALATFTGSPAIAAIRGETLLGERAMARGLRVPGMRSAGGGCRLYPTRDGAVALNLARADDRALLPALFEIDPVPDAASIERLFTMAISDAIVTRGRLLGLAIANEREQSGPALVMMASAPPRRSLPTRAPRVVDLSALWAGPLAGHLLRLAGAEVIKVESRRRPDAMRDGEPDHYGLLNAGKVVVSMDLTAPEDRQILMSLIARADIVIEAARPRALQQLGIDADAIVAGNAGLTWITITGHGAVGEAAHHVGFGDDCGVGGGLSAVLRAASGRSGFVGDAIADPLTGIRAALTAWQGWSSGTGGRYGLNMAGVVADGLAWARASHARRLNETLMAWAAAVGAPFPSVERRVPLPTISSDAYDWATIEPTSSC